ncbi:MAG: superoxide dismutase family protein [Faecousia sp.]
MQKVYPSAAARIHGDSSHPTVRGIVRFFQRENGVIVEAEVTGLPRTETGFFAFHIHEGTNCEGEGFPNAGTHFNPGGALHPNHAGDLPPLLADHGRAYMKVLTGRFHVGEVTGKTVIIHADPDDFHTQPSGNAGKKIACGVIQRMSGRRL